MTHTQESGPARPIRTVGDLIDRLQEFDRDAPIRAEGGLAAETDFILGVGHSPNEPGTVGIVYIPRPK